MRKIAILSVLALLLAVGANAQLQSGTSVNVTVNVTQNSTIAVTETGGNLVIDPTTGTSNQVSFNVQWNIGPANKIYGYAYFSSVNAALSTTGGSQIPASALTATYTSADSNGSGACSNTYSTGVAGAACPQITLASATGSMDLNNAGPNNNIPAHGTNVTFSLSIPGYVAGYGTGMKLSAGAYTGTLNFVVVAS